MTPNWITNWIQTYTGRQFWPMHPRVEDVNLLDIAHALSNICRYAGHTKRFYSVAEHSCYVSQNVPRAYALQALLHDAPEAYLCDLPRPLKNELPDYKSAEQKVWLKIAEHFKIDAMIADEVHDIDNRILLDERRDLMQYSRAGWDLGKNLKPLNIEITGMPPSSAKFFFLGRYRKLMGITERWDTWLQKLVGDSPKWVKANVTEIEGS